MTASFNNINHRWYRWLVYAIMWGWLLAFPIVITSISVAQGKINFSWDYVFPTWIAIMPFFLIFVVNHLLLHVLLPRKMMRTYFVAALCLLGGFCALRYVYQYPKMGDRGYVAPPLGRPLPPSPPSAPLPPPEGKVQDRVKPIEIPMPLALDIIITSLMLGCDFALVLVSRYQQEREDEQKLRATHLQHELQYLKAQIHPHFFMNMLNNIHGMVELDPARAQEMIMELSKLMRYVLYDGTQLFTSWQKEKEFIANYVNLMCKRFSNKKVTITLELPKGEDEGVMVPPLLFISVIENAFKHGISYRNPSFVAIKFSVKRDWIELDCDNSVHEYTESDGREGGVGLSNLRQRLRLIYGERFTLDIEPAHDKYHVKLIIPREYETNTMPSH